MFSSLHSMPRTDAEVAAQVLREESSYRFGMFSANDAVTLGLSIRKRFRGSSRHAKGKGLVVSVQSISGHNLFACTVGDLNHPAGISDVSLDAWSILDNMINVVKRTGHSSYYVEKGMGALGKNSKQLGLGENVRVYGGAFPIWLENAPVCPIAVAACYSGSSLDDHNLMVTTVRDYLNKMAREHGTSPPPPPVLANTRSSKAITESEFMEHEHSEIAHDQETDHDPDHEHDEEYPPESPLTETEHEIRTIREPDPDNRSEIRSIRSEVRSEVRSVRSDARSGGGGSDIRSEVRSEGRSEVQSEARSERTERTERSEVRSEVRSARSGRSGRSGR